MSDLKEVEPALVLPDGTKMYTRDQAKSLVSLWCLTDGEEMAQHRHMEPCDTRKRAGDRLPDGSKHNGYFTYVCAHRLGAGCPGEVRFCTQPGVRDLWGLAHRIAHSEFCAEYHREYVREHGLPKKLGPSKTAVVREWDCPAPHVHAWTPAGRWLSPPLAIPTI